MKNKNISMEILLFYFKNGEFTYSSRHLLFQRQYTMHGIF